MFSEDFSDEEIGACSIRRFNERILALVSYSSQFLILKGVFLLHFQVVGAINK